MKSNGTLYWYGVEGQVLQETDLAGGLLNEYIYFNGQRVARRQKSGETFVHFYYFEDHLGSSRVNADASGNKCYEADFLPYGEERTILNNCSPKHKFTGQERDSETDLDYFIARHYSFRIGRFLQPEPLNISARHQRNPQKWNAYAYSVNNPLRFLDPDGFEEIEATAKAKFVAMVFVEVRGTTEQEAYGIVVNVIMNRVESPESFGAGPYGGGQELSLSQRIVNIVEAKNQFGVGAEETYGQLTARGREALGARSDQESFDKATKAVEDALRANRQDPTKGGTFFSTGGSDTTRPVPSRAAAESQQRFGPYTKGTEKFYIYVFVSEDRAKKEKKPSQSRGQFNAEVSILLTK